ncbi:glycosyltransferase family 4 protein [Microbacterium sp. Sa4CUA7]|uniref:Glycosyltransferase family 4 protein n=1 Tax=Microbacterium pullorum TaxID=2762236 RepID=A0ABR8S4Z7_9MICO|nr:glycosyltransferase family 4 protein [Microbacterium pullorum]MBD7958552.1 glycosyltransferase family 4 protein [Microbacterium pullorum]
MVTDSLDASGMDEFVAFLARGLRAAGWDVKVLVAGSDPGDDIGRLGRALAAEGIQTEKHGSLSGAHWIAQWRPDVVDSHGAALWPLRAARLAGSAAVVTLHGIHNIMGKTPHEMRSRREDVNGFIAVSEMVRAEYLSGDPTLPPHRVVTIPNPVDPGRSRRFDRQAVRAALGLDEEFLFLSLARHSLQKNAFALVSAFGEIAHLHEKTHLLICGRVDDPSYTLQVLALRDRLGLRGRIHLRGNLGDADALLWAADAFVLDSFFEGWALGSMEALGTGLPVILSDVGGAREQLTDGPARGVLIPNPLGRPVGVTWPKISQAAYRRQANRPDLVAAMRGVAEGSLVFADRAVIADHCRARFSAADCLAAHQATLLSFAGERVA